MGIRYVKEHRRFCEDIGYIIHMFASERSCSEAVRFFFTLEFWGEIKRIYIWVGERCAAAKILFGVRRLFFVFVPGGLAAVRVQVVFPSVFTSGGVSGVLW